MKKEHPYVSELKLAIIRLSDRINLYRRQPVRLKIEALNRASRGVSDALDMLVHVYDGLLTRTLLKAAIDVLEKAVKILEKRRPIRRGLNLRWFVAVKSAMKSRYEQFLVLLGEGRASYRVILTDLAVGHHASDVPMV